MDPLPRSICHNGRLLQRLISDLLTNSMLDRDIQRRLTCKCEKSLVSMNIFYRERTFPIAGRDRYLRCIENESIN